MHLPRPRLTIHRLMILVAVAGLLLWSVMVKRARAARLELLAWLDGREKSIKDAATKPELSQFSVAFARFKNGKSMGIAEALEEIERQKRRYRYAASHPWLPVPPDPPEPK